MPGANVKKWEEAGGYGIISAGPLSKKNRPKGGFCEILSRIYSASENETCFMPAFAHASRTDMDAW